MTHPTGPSGPSPGGGSGTGPGRPDRDAERREYIKRLVDQAPPLTEEQRRDLRLILQPVRLPGGRAGT